MNLEIRGYNVIAIVLVTLIISVITVEISKRIAKHIGGMDKPNDSQAFRRIHKVSLPRLGGLGMFLAFLAAYMLYGEMSTQMISVIIGAFILILIGIVDDINDIKQRYKFISHLIAASIVVFYGDLVLSDITALGLNFTIPEPFNYIFTIFFIVGCINAINLIDGIDGLSGGISTIYFLTVGIIAIILNQFGGLDIILSFIMVGVCLGFLFHNFYPATTFAGDCGSQFMGYMIAVVALIGFKATTLTSLIIPLILFSIPIIDTLFAIFRRLLKGQPIGSADKDHLHHQLLKLTSSTRKSVIIIYIINILFASVSIFYVLGDNRLAIIIYVFLMLLLVFLVLKTDILFQHSKKEKEKK